MWFFCLARSSVSVCIDSLFGLAAACKECGIAKTHVWPWFMLTCYYSASQQTFPSFPFNWVSLIILIADIGFNSKCPYFIFRFYLKVNRKESGRCYVVCVCGCGCPMILHQCSPRHSYTIPKKCIALPLFSLGIKNPTHTESIYISGGQITTSHTHIHKHTFNKTTSFIRANNIYFTKRRRYNGAFIVYVSVS